jgi:hypothetical protein
MSALGRTSPGRVALAVPAALAVGAGIAVNGAAAGLLALGLLCALAVWLLARLLTDRERDPDEAARVVRWTLAAFAGHLVLSLAINAVLFSSSDARVYHRDAVGILRHWQGGLPPPVLPHGKEGYYYLLAGLFWLFGTHDLAGLLVNAAFAAALVPVVTDLTRRLLGDDPARFVPWLVVLLPGLLLWTSQLLKEAAIVFFVAVSLNCAVRLLSRLTLLGLATLAASLAVLFTMRSYVGLVLAMGLLGGIGLGRPSVLGGLGAGLAAVVALAVLVAATGVGYSGYKSATSSNLTQANLVRKDLATSANSGFASDVDISTPAGALSSLPMAAATFLLGPLPWHFGGGRQLVALPDVLTWWLLLPSLWRGVRAAKGRIRRGVLVFVLPALMTTALLSLVVSNFGTVVRERTQVEILLVPLLALGLAERAGRRSGTASALLPEADEIGRLDGVHPAKV